ncbi:MAG: glycosyltransferase [Acidobacteria bacterium]|nr:glycosyltransferase [Acidobacteriota bacterium]
MRILYVASGMQIPGSHGGSVHALELCRALSRVGHEVHLVSLPPDRPTDAAVDLDGVHLYPLRTRPMIPQFDMFHWREVKRLAGQIGPDIIVERFYTFGGRGLIAASELGLPSVLEVNSPALPYPGSLRDRLDKLTLVRPVDRWRQWMLRQASRYYATSELLLPDELRDRTTVVVNGVDCETFTPGEPAPDDGPLRLVHVSSFRPWHGTVDLARAFGAAVSAGADLEMICLGEGPELERARRAATDAGAGDRIVFTGSVPHVDVPGYLADAHVGLAPFSPAEFRALELGWYWSPIKLFEYMASGLAIVTADIDALRQLLPEDVAQFYPPGDIEALSTMLIALHEVRDAVRAMGASGRQLALERFTWDHQAMKVTGVLEAALSGSMPRGG